MGILTLCWRPTIFRDVVGQKHIVPILRAMVNDQSVPPAIIFGGVRGTGKTSCARILAAALNCDVDGLNGDACGHCPPCLAVQSTNSMSVLEVDAASNGGVDEVRRIRELCQYAHDGRWRVILLDEAHSMSNEASNALLKILEEPPENTVFVLVTTEIDKILETVRSRSMLFEFRRVNPADIAQRLSLIADQEGIPASESLLKEIAGRVNGGLRDAVMMLDQVRRVGITDAEGYQELFGVPDVSEDLFAAALDGDLARGNEVIAHSYRLIGDAGTITHDLAALVRDLLIIKCGGQPEIPRKRAEELLASVGIPTLTRVMAVLWELKSRLRGFESDQRLSLEMAFVLISEALHPIVESKPPQANILPCSASDPPLTLSEIRDILVA